MAPERVVVHCQEDDVARRFSQRIQSHARGQLSQLLAEGGYRRTAEEVEEMRKRSK